MNKRFPAFLTFLFALLMGALSNSLFAATQWNSDLYTVHSGDYNDDGLLDIILKGKVIIIPMDGLIIPIIRESAVMQQNNDGSYTLLYPVSLSSINAIELSTAEYNLFEGDFNGDGIKDFFLQAHSPDAASFILYGEDSSGLPTLQNLKDVTSVAVNSDAASIIISDINNDGRDDIIITNTGYGYQTALLGSEAGLQEGSDGEIVGDGSDPASGPVNIKVGVLEGELKILPSGATTYRVPVNVPPGINGMQPQLALAYNSRGGNGELGVSWALQGIPSISRCPTNLAIDGFIDGVDYDNNDRLCFGGQRLIPVNGNTSHIQTNTEYRLENNNAIKVVFLDSVEGELGYFAVYYKSGRIDYFGANRHGGTDDATSFHSMELPSGVAARPVPGSTWHLGKSYSWRLKESVDRFGNNVLYHYSSDEDIGGKQLESITYSAYRVTLERESRPDPLAKHDFGMTYQHELERIKEISVAVDGAAPFSRYRLSYQQGDTAGYEMSKLQSIQFCGVDNSCLEPLEMEWTLNFAEFKTFSGYKKYGLDVGYDGRWPVRVGDVNGDGRADIVLFYENDDVGQSVWTLLAGKGSGSTEGVNHYSSFKQVVYLGKNNSQGWGADALHELVDVNGDGKKDVVWMSASGPVVALSKKSGDYDLRPTSIEAFGKNQGWDDSTPIHFTDINSDGRTDIVGFNRAGIDIALGQAEGSFIYSENVLADFGYNQGWREEHSRLIADVNGDGLPDIVGFDNSGARLSFGTGDGYFFSPSIAILVESGGEQDWSNQENFQAADVDGDGRADIIGFSPTGVVVSLSVGDGSFIRMIDELPHYGTGSGWSDLPIFIRDVNSDGYNDIVGFSDDNSVYAAYSKGNGKFNPPEEIENYAPKSVTRRMCTFYRQRTWELDCTDFTLAQFQALANAHFLFVSERNVSIAINDSQGGILFIEDFNGDGALDLIKFNAYKTIISRNQNRPRMVSRFHNGHRGDVTVSLEPLSSSAAYSQTEDATYPERTFRGPYYVTTLVEQDDGKGGQRSTSYAYSDLKVHAQGIGSLGFKEVTITDDQNPLKIKTTTQYSQDWQNHTMGQVVSQSTITEGGQVLSSLNNMLATDEFLYGSQIVYHSYVDISTQQKWDLNGEPMGTTVTDVGMDAYKNSTSKLTTVTDPSGLQYLSEETNVFKPEDESAWFVGLLERQTVTNTIPNELPYQDSTETKTSTYEYYPLSGALRRSTLEPEVEALKSVTEIIYDEHGLPSTTTVTAKDVVTRVSSTNYDDYGRLTSKTNAEQHKSNYFYEDNRFPWLATKSVDPNNIEKTVNFDDFGRAEQEIFADDTSVTSSSNYCSEVGGACNEGEVYFIETQTTASASVTAYYDQFDREIRVSTVGYDTTGEITDALVNQVTSYDSRGRVNEVSSAEYNGVDPVFTKTVYDDLDRPYIITFSDSSTKTITYNGLVIESKRENNDESKSQTTFKKSNAIGQVLQVTDAAENTIDYLYDAFGNTVKTMDSSGISIQIEYDVAGNKVRLNDPDKGEWFYKYDPLGQLKLQTDAKDQQTYYLYDKIGRQINRTDYYGTEDASVASWIYDEGLNGIGQLSTLSETGYVESYIYDDLGRLKTTATAIDGLQFTQVNAYDDYGRVDTVAYPGGGLTIQNVYDNEVGVLVAIQNADNANERYWKLGALTASGQTRQFTLGSGAVTSQGYHPQTGNLISINAYMPLVEESIQSTGYIYDYMGNLKFRQSLGGAITEVFMYDNLNRLDTITTTAPLINPEPVIMGYDNMGNIIDKPGVGQYGYTQNYDVTLHGAYDECANANPGPHAVRSIVGEKPNKFCYDLNGNMIHDNARDIVYSAFDKPTVITQGDKSVEYKYAPSRSRYKRIDRENGSVISSTTYVSNLERVKKGTLVENKYYIGDFAIVTKTEGDTSTTETNYLYRDHLGSLVAITDELGNVIDEFSFDPWGQRRLATFAPITDWNQLSILPTNRGYGDHEQLDEMGLVHMNGRIYDPIIGRFLSADVLVQAPYFTQSYNRYSYTMNNPLSMVDPSGYAAFGISEYQDDSSYSFGYSGFDPFFEPNFDSLFGSSDLGSSWLFDSVGFSDSALSYNSINIDVGLSRVEQGGGFLDGVVNFLGANSFGGSFDNGYSNLLSQPLSDEFKGGVVYNSFLFNTGGPYPSGGAVACAPNCSVGDAALATALTAPLVAPLARLPFTGLSRGGKVDLFGGPASSLKGFTNYDRNAVSGIADDVANFGTHFKPNSLSTVVANNPMAPFVDHVSSAIRSGGTLTVRGQFANKNFSSVWDARSIQGFNIISRQKGISSEGYFMTSGKPIKGPMNEIILEKL